MHAHMYTHTRVHVCVHVHNLYPQGYSCEQTRNTYENADRQQEGIICTNIEVITHQHKIWLIKQITK